MVAVLLEAKVRTHLWTAGGDSLCSHLLARLFAALRLWRRKRRTRRRLAELEPWQLRDIGFGHADASREVRKSFPWHLSVPWHEDGRRPHDGWRQPSETPNVIFKHSCEYRWETVFKVRCACHSACGPKAAHARHDISRIPKI